MTRAAMLVKKANYQIWKMMSEPKAGWRCLSTA
jgi:hypothetical protein